MSTPSRPRATKIICTIGPATDTSDMLGQLIEAGANVFRLNMSHSKHDWVREVVFRIRRKAAELQANIAILFDLQGPSIRTGDLPEPYHLKKGDTLEIRLSTAKPELPFSTTVNYDGLLQDVQVGHTMVVDNGGILMRIEEVRRTAVLEECGKLMDARLMEDLSISKETAQEIRQIILLYVADSIREKDELQYRELCQMGGVQ